jgi:ATP-binding cassette, subfamily B, bacterial
MSLVRLSIAAIRAHARLSPALTAAWVATLVGAMTLPVASAALVGAVVGAVPHGPAAIVPPLIALAAVELASNPCHAYGWVLCWALGRRYRLVHRERIMKALLGPPGVAHLSPETLDAARTADNPWLVNMLEGVDHLTVARVTGAGGLLIVARYQPVAALVLAAAWIYLGRWRWRRTTVTWRVVVGQTQTMRRAHAISDMAVTAAAAKETRLFGLRTWIGVRHAAEWTSAMSSVWAERRRAGRGATLVALVLFGAHLVALALIGQAALAGGLGLGPLAAILQGVFLARELGEGVFGHWEVEFGLPLLDAVRRLEETVEEQAEPMSGSLTTPQVTEAIRFEGVRFRYPGGADDVLCGLDLEIPAGTSLAIVGENGVGKTTTAQLLARLRDPSAGRITVDGADLTTIDPEAWHQTVAAVSQQAVRLPLTAAENVGAGRTLDPDALRRAVEGAGARRLIEGLPRGWDTVLDKTFTGGADLSGGQWQRVALARGLAALEAGAQVLILDEPTAHLDVRAEADLYDRFLELTRGRTVVLISHRFSTVRRADRIAVIEGGRIVELGSHDELMALRGRYATMFELQAARFRADAGEPA